MDIQTGLRNRILIATLGIGVASAANAFPRVTVDAGQREPIAPWSDPANPLSLYGIQSFSSTVYRPMVDELLSREDRSIFEDLYSAGTARLVAKTEKLSQSTLLAYGLLEIATSFGEDEPEMAFNLIAENIAEFNADPAKITQEIAQHLLDTEQVVLTGEDTDTMVSPPETRMGAKAALENLQIRLKQQEIGLEALASVFTNLTEPRSKPTNQMLIKEMGELLAALDKCPEPGDALSVLFDLSEEEMTNSISFKR